ncbi:MAG: ABC transporter permease [Oscillospiraceae bacterium]|nr:ABC transporter permease [Oscillospiraceae bacterium]
MENYEVVIRSKTKWYDLNLKEVLKYKDLIKLFVQRNFALIYKQTVLGPLWLVLNPLVTSVVFTVVFGQFAGLSTNGMPQFLFYMSGNTIWMLFSSSVSGTSSTFLNNAHIFGKVYFPRLTVPVSQMITSVINFFIQFVMLVVVYAGFLVTGAEGVSFSPYFLLLAVIIAQTALFGTAIGIIISSVTIKYRDLAVAAGLILQMWMYLTPIVYTLETVSGPLRTLLLLNPMTAVVNNFRYCLAGNGTFLTGWWIYSLIVTVAVAFGGVVLYNKMEKNFVDSI